MVQTTRVSNPFRFLNFRSSVSDCNQWSAFTTGIPPKLYEFHLSVKYSYYLNFSQEFKFSMLVPSWVQIFNNKFWDQPTNALRPINSNNAFILCITASAGTELDDDYSNATVILKYMSSHKKDVYNPQAFL